jgi:hypothetical protein
MIRMSIYPKNDFLASLVAAFRSVAAEGVLKRTEVAFATGASMIANSWRAYAMKEDSLSGALPLKNASAAYAAGVKVRKMGPFDYTIYNDAKNAGIIENGAPQLDMKQTHPYGDKGRVTNKGTRTNPRWVPYLIVPMRWGTPGSSGHFRNIIPEQVYKMMLAQMKSGTFTRTRKLSTTHDEPNFWGEEVQRAEYEGENGTQGWGSMLRGIGGNLEGLSVMAADEGYSSGVRSSTYFTFRIISADSPAESWIRPSQPAYKVTQALAASHQGDIDKMVQAGLRADISG